MNLRNLLLAASVHLAIAAIAQDGRTRTVTRNVDVQNNDGECTITISTTENGVTETRVLTGDEAKAYLKEKGTLRNCSPGKNEGTCKVVVVTDGEGSEHRPESKASVMRYRYDVKDGKKGTDAPAEVVVEMGDAADAFAIVTVPDEDGYKTLEIPASAFTFFPNPSKGACTMQYELPDEGDAVITIVDPSGREIYEERTSGRGPQTRTIDLTGKGPGEFIARLAQGGVTLLKKLVIE